MSKESLKALRTFLTIQNAQKPSLELALKVSQFVSLLSAYGTRYSVHKAKKVFNTLLASLKLAYSNEMPQAWLIFTATTPESELEEQTVKPHSLSVKALPYLNFV